MRQNIKIIKEYFIKISRYVLYEALFISGYLFTNIPQVYVCIQCRQLIVLYFIVTSALLKRRTEYLVDTTNCHIPETDPFDETIIKFVRKENYTDCRNMELLTYIKKDFDKVTLNINSSVLPQYINGFRTISCCFSEIYREEGNDNKVR